MFRTRHLLPALAAALLLLPASPSLAADASVSVVDKAFTPADVTIAAGEAVTWTFAAGGHNVRITEGPVRFDSGFLDQGATFRRVLGTAGTYRYVCDAHTEMRGVVNVTGATAASAPAAAPGPPAALSTTPPRLGAVRVSSRALVLLRSSGAGSLRLRLVRGGRTARRWTVPLAAGANRVPLAIGHVRLGRYRLELRAMSASGRPAARVVRSVVVTRTARAAARRLAAVAPGSTQRTPGTPPPAAPAPASAPAPAPAPAQPAPAQDAPDDSDGREREREDDQR